MDNLRGNHDILLAIFGILMPIRARMNFGSSTWGGKCLLSTRGRMNTKVNIYHNNAIVLVSVRSCWLFYRNIHLVRSIPKDEY